MARMTTKMTTALAGLALATLPALVGAQSATSTQQPPTTGSTTQQNRSERSTDQNSPQHHLDQAKDVLNSINASSLQGEARTHVTELKRHFSQLENAWRSQTSSAVRSGASGSGHTTAHTSGTTTGSATTGTTGTSGTTGSTTTEPTGTSRETTPRGAATAGGDNWMTHYQAIDRVLDQLIGDNPPSAAGRTGATGSASGMTGSATGTSGTSGIAQRSPSSAASADVTLDASVRSRLVEFRQHLDRFHAAAMASHGRMGEGDRASASPYGGVIGSMSGTTGATTSGAPGTSGQATASQPTSRMQTGASAVSTNVDSAAIARITAAIDEMLSDSPATSATAGTTGTSGSTSATGTVCVDRAKLEQLRRDVQALNRK